MLAVHRRNEILDLIQKNQFISVRKLCSILFYSEATIRRDLEQLEKDGAIIRIRGGAMIREGLNIELPLNLRQVNNIRQKNAIAAKAAELIEDNDVLFLTPPALSSACFITLTNSRTLPLSRTVSKPDLH